MVKPFGAINTALRQLAELPRNWLAAPNQESPLSLATASAPPPDKKECIEGCSFIASRTSSITKTNTDER